MPFFKWLRYHMRRSHLVRIHLKGGGCIIARFYKLDVTEGKISGDLRGMAWEPVGGKLLFIDLREVQAVESLSC